MDEVVPLAPGLKVSIGSGQTEPTHQEGRGDPDGPPGRSLKLRPEKHLKEYRHDQKKPETLASISGMLNATSPSQEDALPVRRDASSWISHSCETFGRLRRAEGWTPDVPDPRPGG